MERRTFLKQAGMALGIGAVTAACGKKLTLEDELKERRKEHKEFWKDKLGKPGSPELGYNTLPYQYSTVDGKVYNVRSQEDVELITEKIDKAEKAMREAATKYLYGRG